MNARSTRLVSLGSALALAAPLTHAADPQLDEPEQQEAPAEDRAAWDISGRLRATHDGLTLELGGALVELRVSGDPLSGGELDGSGEPGAHDFRATFSVDGKTTNLLLRIVPPPGSGTPAAPR